MQNYVCHRSARNEFVRRARCNWLVRWHAKASESNRWTCRMTSGRVDFQEHGGMRRSVLQSNAQKENESINPSPGEQKTLQEKLNPNTTVPNARTGPAAMAITFAMKCFQ